MVLASKRERKIIMQVRQKKKVTSQQSVYHFLVESADVGKEGDQLTVCLAQGGGEGGVLGLSQPRVVPQRVAEGVIDRDHLLHSR